MRTKEFIEKVKELDYGCTIDGHYIVVSDDYGTPVTISRYKMYYMTIETDDDKLGKLSYEYALTPIEEREGQEEEKKYYLKLKDSTSAIMGEYLNFNKSFNVYFLQNNFQCNDYQTRFTQKEIDEIKKELDTDLAEFEQIEVKEWKGQNL